MPQDCSESNQLGLTEEKKGILAVHVVRTRDIRSGKAVAKESASIGAVVLNS